jgi:hypothetical protein
VVWFHCKWVEGTLTCTKSCTGITLVVLRDKVLRENVTKKASSKANTVSWPTRVPKGYSIKLLLTELKIPFNLLLKDGLCLIYNRGLCYSRLQQRFNIWIYISYYWEWLCFYICRCQTSLSIRQHVVVNPISHDSLNAYKVIQETHTLKLLVGILHSRKLYHERAKSCRPITSQTLSSIYPSAFLPHSSNLPISLACARLYDLIQSHLSPQNGFTFLPT